MWAKKTEKKNTPNRIINKRRLVNIRPGWEVLPPRPHQRTNTERTSHRPQGGGDHGERGAGEPVPAGVEVGIVVVDAGHAAVARAAFWIVVVLLV